MAQTVIVRNTIVEGTPWFRICMGCGAEQSEQRHANEPCEYCGCEAVLQMPLNSGYEDVEL